MIEMKHKQSFFVFGLVIILVLSGTTLSFADSETPVDGKTLIEDFDEINKVISAEEEYPFPEKYPSVQELYTWYDELETEHDIVEKHHYGHSYEGRDLWALEITSDEDTQVDNKPGVLIDGALHAREWSSVQVSAYLMWRLVEEYETNETIYWLVNNRRIFIIPMTNPDGYIYDGDGDLDARQGWRKNRNDSIPEDEVGVDLNRNWDVNFGGRGASDDPGSDTYHGEKSFSEPETYHLKEFLLEMDVNSYQNLHSHADCLLIPYMHTNDPSPHDDWYRGMADNMTSFTSLLGDESQQYSYGQPQDEIGYSAAGGASDWAYAKEGLQGLTYEIHTPDDGMDGFYPDEEYIMPINKDLDDSLIYQVRVSDVDLGDGPMGEGGEDLFPPVPYLVYGEVADDSGEPSIDAEVEIESQVTGEQLSIDTNSKGYYEINFGNFDNEDSYDIGDSFTVTVDQDQENQVDFVVDDNWGKRIDFTFAAGTNVVTKEPSQVTMDSAELVGEVTLGDQDEVDGFFQFRVEDEEDWYETEEISINSDGEFTDSVGGLEARTDYEFRAGIRWDGTEEDFGEVVTFTTHEDPLEPAIDIRIEKDEATEDIILRWDDIGVSEYNVYYSQDLYAGLDAWENLGPISDSDHVHSGVLGGENYYFVTSIDGGERSGIAFCVERHFQEEGSKHYVSIPSGFDYDGDGELRASDIVLSIEGNLDSSDYISEVARWDHLTRDYDETYHYQEGQWLNDFVIEPGDGIAFTVEDEFTWHINATDTRQEISFGGERPRHYTSIPYTLEGQREDGRLMASDIVKSIEGDLETSEYIFDVVRWDPSSQGYEERYYYDAFAGQWTGDFVIEPGDGIGLGSKGAFIWQVELITPS